MRSFGGVDQVQEKCRDLSRLRFIEAFGQDARYALRGMKRSPGFTAVVVLSLALGIGANTAIFSLLDTVMLRRLPVQHPEELVELLQKYPNQPRQNGFWSRQSFEHFRDNNHVFSALTCTGIDTQTKVSVESSEPETLIGESVPGNYFPVLGLKPALGRLIGPDDNPTSAAVAVVSWSYWKSRFHLDPAILGKQIVLDGRLATIVGVAPRGFFGVVVGSRTDVWAPGTEGSILFGRLRSGVSLEQARAEMSVLYRFTLEELSRTIKGVAPSKVEVEPAAAGLSRVRDRFAQPLVLLMVVVGVLLLIACVNTANMLLARAAGRQREMAVRVGLGATRIRLVQQVMTESALLSAVAALFGILLAHVGTGVLVRIIASGREHERFILPVQLDLRLLAFTVGVALLTALLFGLAPALHAFRAAPASALRQTGRAGETRLRRLFGRGLVAAQVASSVLLLSAAGLFLGYLSHLRNLDLGFQRDHVLLVTLDPERSGFKREQLGRLYEDLVGRLESIPGISSVSISAVSPIQGAGAGRFVTAEGRPQRPEDGRVSLNWVAPKYFETLGTPFLAGRDFQFQDQAHARVTIINHLMARYYFGDASPVGRRITLDGDEKPYEVVGVVGDAKYLDIRETPARTMYFNTFQERWLASQFALRTRVDPAAVTGEVRRAVREVLKSVPVTRVITLADQVDASIVPERLIATLSGLFGALGSLLAAIGLSGLLAYTVAQRTNEIGIRMALGATRGAMSRMVLLDALQMSFWGLMIGMPIAYWGRRFATSMIPDLPLDSAFPIVFGALTMIAIALLAAYVPAHRAARVDPMEALRCE